MSAPSYNDSDPDSELAETGFRCWDMVAAEGNSAACGETEPAKYDCRRADRTALHRIAAGGGRAAGVITAAPTPAPASQQSSKAIPAMTANLDETTVPEADFAERVRRNQQQLGAQLRPQYDFIVCGSGSSGSVVARRLAENASVSVLLLEAGGPDDVPEVMRAEQWPANLGSERDWNFAAQPNPHLNGRAIAYSMGKVLGGGSSINVMAWSRGHKNDWDYFASEAGDKAWSYESVLNIYRRIEAPPSELVAATDSIKSEDFTVLESPACATNVERSSVGR